MRSKRRDAPNRSSNAGTRATRQGNTGTTPGHCLTSDLPPATAVRAVPLYCRLSLEAASTEVVRRRRIGRGKAHAGVEEVLTDARTLLQKLVQRS